jgi:Ca-activated chloride channel family protein
MIFSMKLVPHIALLACACLCAAGQEMPAAPSASRPQAQPAPAPQHASPPQTGNTAPQPTPSGNQPANPPQTNQAQTAADPQKRDDGSTGEPSSNNGDQVTTIVTTVNEVPVVFTVTDRHGHYVRDLKASDFHILDDNKPPQKISEFRAETDLPVRMGLLIDASNSIRERFDFEQEAAIEFLSQVLRPRFDQAFVLGFDTTAEVSQDFTDDTEKLAKGVRQFRPGGGTAIYDAIYYACHDKLAKAGHGQAVRRAVVVISDGEDNQSRYTRADAIAAAQRAEVIIYAISTNISGMKSKGDDVLKEMADQTGGRAFFPFKLQDLSSHFTDIEKELRSQYFVAYRPSDFVADGRFHTIQITASDAKKYHVRARRGYYAPRQ